MRRDEIEKMKKIFEELPKKERKMDLLLN